MGDEATKRLVLHIEVDGIWADDLEESARLWAVDADAPLTAADLGEVVTTDWVRDEVGLTVVTRPSDGSLNHEFEVHAYVARIVGAELKDRT